MRQAASLTLVNLEARYRSRLILTGLTLPPISPGTIVALVGPNGAGKSTMLRALAGQVPASGTAMLGDLDIVGCKPAARAAQVGFMPQGLPASNSLTVLESVLVALRSGPRSGIDGRRLRLQALATLDRIGIAGLGLMPLSQLSGGQRQLAGLAQAIVRDPSLFLLDEPTSALDLRHQVEVMTLLRSLAGEGRIVIVVLHDIALAARWADHVLLLDRGKLHAAGPPRQAITPATLAAVYGVRARVEADPAAGLTIVVDGLSEGTDDL